MASSFHLARTARFSWHSGWHNNEVDTPNHLMVQYLRTGDRRTFHLYESTLRHMMDVDTIHANLPELEHEGHEWERGQWSRGGMHRHGYNHYKGIANLGHTWNEGLANYYFLTGDPRARKVALDVARFSLGMPRGEVRSSERSGRTTPTKSCASPATRRTRTAVR